MAPARRKPQGPKRKSRRVAEPEKLPREPPKKGRPSKLTPELANEICIRIGTGQSLRSICREAGFPDWTTVHRWVHANKDFAAKYREARQLQYQVWADEIVDIADDGTNDYVQTKNGTKFNREYFERSRLRVDSRKWLLSKLVRPVYGERTAVEGGEKPIEIRIEERNALINAIVGMVKPKPDPESKPPGSKDEPRER